MQFPWDERLGRRDDHDTAGRQFVRRSVGPVPPAPQDFAGAVDLEQRQPGEHDRAKRVQAELVRWGVTVEQAGLNTGRTVFDACAVRAQLPELTIFTGPPLAANGILSPTNPN